MDLKPAGTLQEHMLWTYYGLRVALTIIGFGLPIALVVAGVVQGTWLEPSISAYYYTPSVFGAFATRDIFVGGLVAAGFCLYLYKGFSDRENIALNIAGVCAALVGLLPSGAPGTHTTPISVAHAASAILFFALIAYVSLFRSRDTLSLIPDPRQRAAFARRYSVTGVMMIVSPLAALALALWLEPFSAFRPLVFWVETLGIWSFAAYWYVKTREMRISQAEKRSLAAQLSRSIAPDPLGTASSKQVEQIM